MGESTLLGEGGVAERVTKGLGRRKGTLDTTEVHGFPPRGRDLPVGGTPVKEVFLWAGQASYVEWVVTSQPPRSRAITELRPLGWSAMERRVKEKKRKKEKEAKRKAEN